ncbi:MAG: acyltransferase [Clostridia bacterium]|nr:acyltransferase [Clostridia bacterium]
MVIYGHMGAIMGIAPFSIFSQSVSTIAVKIFFTISGFLVTKSFLSDSNFPRYMVRRCFRIFPALIFVVFVSAILIGPIFSYLSPSQYFAHPFTRNYFLNILLHPSYSLPGVFENYVYPNTFNGSLWTLPVEFFTYLILPPIILLLKKLKAMKTGIAVCAVISLVISVLYITVFTSKRFVFWGSDWFQMLPLIPYFFIGSFYSLIENKKFFNLQFGIILTIIALFTNTVGGLNEIVVFIVIPYLILSIALCEKPLFSHWFEKCEFSYGIYLWGFPVQQIVYHRLAGLGLNSFNMALISFSCALVAAIVSWYAVEKPMMKLGQKIVRKMREKSSLRRALKTDGE